MSATVAVLLVSHDGARWLPTVIEGIRAQRRPVDRVVAVDTTSRDDSPALLTEAFGPVVTAPGGTGYPAAVRLGMAEADDADWIWLLHDDSTPDPGALEELLAAADADPDADILGPKLREWPSLRRLLELGITISGTGRRETGLERGEYDQGQHDDVGPVLAVNTAGMLVRRSVLEKLGGLDQQMPIFGNDIDFGWRAAAAGHKTLIVPQAVVFHAEAAHRGVRRTPLTGRHIHYQERRAALYTLLVNASTRSLPWRVLRLGLGTLVRMVGLLLVRQVGQALDELAALASLYGNPGLLMRARRDRRIRRTASGTEPVDVKPLLAPAWVPYRHGLDFVSDLAAAATNQAADVAERRRIASGKPVRVVDEEDPWAEEQGWVARFFTNPVALGSVLFVLLALIGAREAFGTVAGGALSPAPESVGQWWRFLAESQHALGQGTPVPAPAYVLPLALLGSVVGPTGTVSLLLVLAVPLLVLGLVALPARRRPTARRPGPAQLAALPRCRDLRADPGRERRLGAGPARRRGRRDRAAVAGPRGARLRRSRARPSLARRVAHRTAAGAGRGVRPAGLLVLPRARRARGRCRLLGQRAHDARPVGLGSSRDRAGLPGAAARAVVAARAADRCRARPGPRHRPAADGHGRLRGPGHRPPRRRRRPGGAGAAAARRRRAGAGAGRVQDPGPGLLDRGAGGRAGRGWRWVTSRSSATPSRPRPASASS